MKKFLPLATLLALPAIASAHTGVGSASGLSAGFAHPLTGIDHLCVMLAVGLWAAQLGGRAIWAVPATFVSVMLIGGLLGMNGVHLAGVEHGIVLSVLILGVLVASAAKLPLSLGGAIVGLFALLHGHAHGTEMPATVAGIDYGIGFLTATALLHTIGIGLGIGVQKLGSETLVRYAGVAIIACGVYLVAF